MYLQKWRVNFEIFGDYVEAEQVTIDAFTTHCVLVSELMTGTRFAKQGDLFFSL